MSDSFYLAYLAAKRARELLDEPDDLPIAMTIGLDAEPEPLGERLGWRRDNVGARLTAELAQALTRGPKK